METWILEEDSETILTLDLEALQEVELVQTWYVGAFLRLRWLTWGATIVGQNSPGLQLNGFYLSIPFGANIISQIEKSAEKPAGKSSCPSMCSSSFAKLEL